MKDLDISGNGAAILDRNISPNCGELRTLDSGTIDLKSIEKQWDEELSHLNLIH